MSFAWSAATISKARSRATIWRTAGATSRIAIVHDGEAYGRGLAEETKRQLNARGVQEALFTEITPDNADYGGLVAELSAVGADVVYYGGYAPEAGLIIRQARNAGDDVQLVVGDGVSQRRLLADRRPGGRGHADDAVARCSGKPGGGRGGGQVPRRQL